MYTYIPTYVSISNDELSVIPVLVTQAWNFFEAISKGDTKNMETYHSMLKTYALRERDVSYPRLGHVLGNV